MQHSVVYVAGCIYKDYERCSTALSMLRAVFIRITGGGSMVYILVEYGFAG